MDGFDARARLSAIECLTLLLQADSPMGAAMTDEEGERAAEIISDCTFVQCGASATASTVITQFTSGG